MRAIVGILAVIGGIAVAAGIAGAVYFFGGFVDVSQTAVNPPVLDWTLRHVREASIERRAGGMAIPDSVNDPEQIRKGAFEFVEEGCVQCHGAPGHRPQRFTDGLNPRAPDLTRARIEPGEAFWAVTNGIKVTGMPAHTRMPLDERWEVTAFVTHMAAVTADQFSQWSTAPREASEENK